MPSLASNKKAFHTYAIEDGVEAGLVLEGPEVKSVRNGQVSLNGAYVSIRGGQAYLKNSFIAKYKNSTKQETYNENRDRKLLLHKDQIIKLSNRLNEKGTAIIPLEIYTSKRRIKIRIAVGKGKKQFDKRATIKAKENKRKIDRTLRTRV